MENNHIVGGPLESTKLLDNIRKKENNPENDESRRIKQLKLDFDLVSVGNIETIFNKKNGTPRQSGICPQSKGLIRLNKQLFNNPMHAFEGIDQFQYVWILYYFHQNTNKRRFIAKVKPPRLNGTSCGVFASRAPHRPNPLGLTLARIDCVKDGVLHVSGIDIIDGTPIVDIKPYIPKYDSPLFEQTFESNQELSVEDKEEKEKVSNVIIQEKPNNLPKDWVNGSVVTDILVDFTARSLVQLSSFHPSSFHESPVSHCNYCFRLFQSECEAKQAIVNLLQADPRSVYRRTKCVDRLYFFTIDTIHITAWFDIENDLVEVLKVKPYVCN